jgi:hypothetical protein
MRVPRRFDPALMRRGDARRRVTRARLWDPDALLGWRRREAVYVSLEAPPVDGTPMGGGEDPPAGVPGGEPDGEGRTDVGEAGVEGTGEGDGEGEGEGSGKGTGDGAGAGGGGVGVGGRGTVGVGRLTVGSETVGIGTCPRACVDISAASNPAPRSAVPNAADLTLVRRTIPCR